jgi:DNA-directed RNA polymerase specialized sigma24 family protein
MTMGAVEPSKGEPGGLAALRARFLEIARGRVEEEAVEDVVQDALAIVHRKGAVLLDAGELPPLPWCFRVLRNVIGNHYQRAQTRARASNPGSAEHARVVELFTGRPAPTPLEALERRELTRVLEEAIDELAARDAECGRLLREMLGRGEGGGAASCGPSSAGYVRAFRCRRKLREILLRRGVRA